MVFDKNLIINFCWGPEILETKYGIKFSEFMGRNIKELLPNLQNEEKLGIIDQIIIKEEFLDLEWHVEFPNGKFWIDISFSPVKDEGMNFAAVVTSVKDISNTSRRFKQINNRNGKKEK